MSYYRGDKIITNYDVPSYSAKLHEIQEIHERCDPKKVYYREAQNVKNNYYGSVKKADCKESPGIKLIRVSKLNSSITRLSLHEDLSWLVSFAGFVTGLGSRMQNKSINFDNSIQPNQKLIHLEDGERCLDNNNNQFNKPLVYCGTSTSNDSEDILHVRLF